MTSYPQHFALRGDGIDEASGLATDTDRIDPRIIKADGCRLLGFKPTPLLKAIREKCVDCMGGSPSAILECTSGNCPLWPFRMGTNPWRPEPTEAQRAHSKAMGEKLRASATKEKAANSQDGVSGPAGIPATPDP